MPREDTRCGSVSTYLSLSFASIRRERAAEATSPAGNQRKMHCDVKDSFSRPSSPRRAPSPFSRGAPSRSIPPPPPSCGTTPHILAFHARTCSFHFLVPRRANRRNRSAVNRDKMEKEEEEEEEEEETDKRGKK